MYERKEESRLDPVELFLVWGYEDRDKPLPFYPLRRQIYELARNAQYSFKFRRGTPFGRERIYTYGVPIPKDTELHIYTYVPHTSDPQYAGTKLYLFRNNTNYATVYKQRPGERVQQLLDVHGNPWLNYMPQPPVTTADFDNTFWCNSTVSLMSEEDFLLTYRNVENG
jgi:hypothetical protein